MCIVYMYVPCSLQSDEMEVFYSTPSRYVDALNKVNKTWTVKTDDFFPYADNAFSYWTGIYTYNSYIYPHNYTCTHSHTHTHSLTCAHTHSLIHPPTHTHTHTYTHTHIHTHTHTHHTLAHIRSSARLLHQQTWSKRIHSDDE